MLVYFYLVYPPVFDIIIDRYPRFPLPPGVYDGKNDTVLIKVLVYPRVPQNIIKVSFVSYHTHIAI
jgi:hypothetical protein